MTDEERLQAAYRGGSMDPTHGLAGLGEGSRRPDEIVMEAEEEGTPDVNRERLEFFDRLMGFFFADNMPGHPVMTARRAYAVARWICPSVLDGATGEGVEAALERLDYWDCETAGQVGGLANSPMKILLEEEDWAHFCRVILLYFFGDGKPERPELVAIRIYGLAKALFPRYLGEFQSLHSLGVIFHEGKPGCKCLTLPSRWTDEQKEQDCECKHRARWSARVKRVFNQLIEAADGVAHAHFQKSASTCRKYSERAAGNENRKGTGKRDE